MTFATGSRTEVTFLKETVYGTTPVITPGDTQVVPFISNNLNLTKGIFEDPSIQSNRQSKFSRHGNKEVAGDVSFAYAHETYDAFLESLMFNTFSTDILIIGQTTQSYSIEVGHQDISQYRIFTGIVANSLSLEVNLDGVVQSTFGLIGKDTTISGTAQDSAPTAQVDKQPMVHFDGTFKEGGSAIALITSISLNIDNGLTSNFALGDSSLKSVTSSMVAVSGTVTAYFEDAVLYNKFVNETETSIEFTLDDGSVNTHTYLLPKVKYNTSSIDISDGNTLPITLEFVGLYDSATDSIVKITRTAIV